MCYPKLAVFEPCPEKRHFVPFSRAFLTIFSVLFGDLAQKRANWHEFSPEKRWF
jgi:hypothetical protein